ncbi:hypothetical protein O6H91_20G001900 [Diphasiastrum complanatum]|uniref:Uncharacterized protein n=1 Tax=Diphasiastrum complanatum TaxID=34168 RepID=A0ACC2AMI1_DIPCM|nr:hypothetical protein O6H91_20G001900 [Diphasiastrum complanatum]
MKTTQKTTQKTYEQVNQNESQRAPEARTNTSRRRYVVLLAACFFIVAIVSGAVALGRLRSKKHLDQSQIVAIAGVCNVTTFPDICVSSLSSYDGSGNTSNPQDLVGISMIVAFQGVRNSLDLVEDLYPQQNNETVKAALKDCLEILPQALEQVNASIVRFNDATDNSSSSDGIADAQTWMSSALTYQTTCTIDEFENVTGKVKEHIAIDGVEVEKLLRNALALLQAFASAGNDLSNWKAP